MGCCVYQLPDSERSYFVTSSSRLPFCCRVLAVSLPRPELPPRPLIASRKASRHGITGKATQSPPLGYGDLVLADPQLSDIRCSLRFYENEPALYHSLSRWREHKASVCGSGNATSIPNTSPISSHGLAETGKAEHEWRSTDALFNGVSSSHPRRAKRPRTIRCWEQSKKIES
jgi:hypothetical protein